MEKIILPATALVFLILGSLFWFMYPSSLNTPDREWREYLGGPDRNHFSVLDQITIDNVNGLEMAWQYHTGDTGQIQCNPIVVNGVLYGMTATTQPFAINAATGQEIWRKEAKEGENQLSTSRGLVYWEEGEDQRIL
jgi:quinoprotein glucose dehydrogenase